MRSLIRVAVLVLALWICGECAALEHRCVYDEVNKPPQAPSKMSRVSRNRVSRISVPDEPQTYVEDIEEEFSPIRIHFSALDVFDEDKICLKEGDERPDFRGGTVKCRADDVLTVRKKSLLLDEILPKAIDLHRERLFVRRETKPLGVQRAEVWDTFCQHFKTDTEADAHWYPNTDTLIYVAATPNTLGSTSWSSICLKRITNGRPLFGALVVSPSAIVTDPKITRIVAHEIAHILGFDSTVFHEHRIVENREIPARNKEHNFVVTPLVIAAAKQHYHCKSAIGMEVNHALTTIRYDTHWSRRNAKDELMSPIVGIGRYTAITMALFESLGFYRANWANAEYMKWGKDGGCKFLESKCVLDAVSLDPKLFCTKSRDEGIDAFGCASDRRAIGGCDLKKHESEIPHELQYFNDPFLGGEEKEEMEHCPVFSFVASHSCIDGEVDKMPYSVIGSRSRCLDVDSLSYNEGRVPALCAEIRCSREGYEIRYKGATDFVKCPAGWAVEPVQGTGFVGGKILCPPYEEMCGSE